MHEAWALVLVVCGSIVTVAGAAGVVWWLVKPRVADWVEDTLLRPVRETHHQVTVNHHSSGEPTVLDKISDVERAVRGVAEENAVQNRTLESVQANLTALTFVLDEHLRGSTD